MVQELVPDASLAPYGLVVAVTAYATREVLERSTTRKSAGVRGADLLDVSED